MVGIFESTVSLGNEVVVLCLLVGAFFLKTRKRYRQHGIVMFSAVVLHIVSILVVMVPSFAAFVGPGSVNFANVLVMVTFIHVSVGLVTALLGVWLVLSWRFKVDIRGCFRKKRVMDATLVLWLLTITMGIYLYLAFIGAI
jgi:membrane-bound metal-dependent hydrolase YbcI (DUF457 family)